MLDSTTLLVYDFLSSYIREHGYAPNVREIARACYVGHSTVSRHLVCLERAGLIRRYPGIARGIDLAEMARDSTKISESL